MDVPESDDILATPTFAEGPVELASADSVFKNRILKSHGRPPWSVKNFSKIDHCLYCFLNRYGEDGRPLSDAFVVGIAGGSGSGKVPINPENHCHIGLIANWLLKTFVAQHILKQMEHLPTVVIMSQDSFYNRLNEEQLKNAFESRHDFDHPKSLDLELFASVSIFQTQSQTFTHVLKVPGRLEGLQAGKYSEVLICATSKG